ncbi:hypothetical protein [Nonomuraea sp. NPDC003754]
MRNACTALRGQLAETLAEHDRLTFAANQVPVPAERESARIAVRPNKAADAYGAALARHRTVLDAQTLELTGLYQAACVRFALAAAVVEACDCGDDCAWLPDGGRALAAEATAHEANPDVQVEELPDLQAPRTATTAPQETFVSVTLHPDTAEVCLHTEQTLVTLQPARAGLVYPVRVSVCEPCADLLTPTPTDHEPPDPDL